MPIYRYGVEELVPLPARKMSELKIRERGDLQRLLRDRIEVISPGTLVISEEYTGWSGSLRRIDLLGVDPDGTLVVFELKRTQDGGHMDLQGIRYAAMASVLTFEDLVEVYADYLGRRDSGQDAEAALRGHLETEEDGEVGARVRIVLASADFGQEVTTTVLWLNEQGLDVRCVRLEPYQDGDSIYLDVQQIIPVPEAADYTVRLREKRDESRAGRGSKRDYTKFHVVVNDDVEHRALPKNRAIFTVVKALHGFGVSPVAMRNTINQGLRRFYAVEGIVEDEEEYLERASAAADLNDGRVFDPRRYFTDPEDLMVFEGRTYAFSNQWGLQTEKKIRALVEAHGEGRIRFEKDA